MNTCVYVESGKDKYTQAIINRVSAPIEWGDVFVTL